MASLVTVLELQAWPGAEGADFGDAFTTQILEAASEKVRLAARQPTWTRETAPIRARQIAWHLAGRSYANPGSLSRENIGPLGESRVEDLARALHLTAAEEVELEALAPAGAIPMPGQGTLWVQPLRLETPLDDGDIIISGMVYAHPDDAFAFTPLEP